MHLNNDLEHNLLCFYAFVAPRDAPSIESARQMLNKDEFKPLQKKNTLILPPCEPMSQVKHHIKKSLRRKQFANIRAMTLDFYKPPLVSFGE